MVVALLDNGRAQNSHIQNPPSAPVDPPTLRLAYSEPLRSTVMTLGMGIGGTMKCAADGSTLFTAFVYQMKPKDPVVFSAYEVRSAGSFVKSVRYDPALATELRHVMPVGAGIAVSENRVVMLVRAITADEEAKDTAQRMVKKPHPFLLFFDRSGKFLYAAGLDLDFDVGAFGIFESGNIFIAGLANVNDAHRHWALVDDHGHLLRYLQPGTEGDEDRKVGDLRDFAKSIMSLTGQPQLLPYRGKLVLLEQNTTHPLLEMNEGGVVRAVSLKLPKNKSLGHFIPSDGPYWKVILGQTDAQGSAAEGIPPGLFRPDTIADFDPETGELLHYYDTGSDHYPISLSCEHDGEFTALRTDPGDGSLVVETATVRP